MDVEAEFVYADILRTLQNSILNSNVSYLSKDEKLNGVHSI